MQEFKDALDARKKEEKAKEEGKEHLDILGLKKKILGRDSQDAMTARSTKEAVESKKTKSVSLTKQQQRDIVAKAKTRL